MIEGTGDSLKTERRSKIRQFDIEIQGTAIINEGEAQGLIPVICSPKEISPRAPDAVSYLLRVLPAYLLGFLALVISP